MRLDLRNKIARDYTRTTSPYDYTLQIEDRSFRLELRNKIARDSAKTTLPYDYAL